MRVNVKCLSYNKVNLINTILSLKAIQTWLTISFLFLLSKVSIKNEKNTLVYGFQM